MAVGAIVIVTVQEAPAARLVPQLFVSLNGFAFGVSVMLSIVTAAPVLEIVYVWEVPTFGDAETPDGPVSVSGSCPTPVRVTACGDPDVLSEIVIVAVRVPSAEGVNTTETVQDDPG